MNEVTAEKAEKVALVLIGLGAGVFLGMNIAYAGMRRRLNKLKTMNKLSADLLNWGIKNGLRTATVEQDRELYEKLSYIGLASRGMR